MSKNVQAVIPDPLYEKLASVARRQDRPLKAVMRSAIEAYVAEGASGDKDPLDDFIGSGSLGGGWSTRKDWRA